jgi:AraC-like DNA-binding protein
MKKGQDIAVNLPEIQLIHQKVPGREIGQHSHAEHEFFIPLQGEIKVSYGNTSLSCGPGRMLYVPPDLDHSFSSSASGEGERIIILISKSKWKKSSNEKTSPTLMPLNSLIRELTFYLLLNPNSRFSNTFVSALTESLIDILSIHKNMIEDVNSQLESKVTDPRIKKAIQLIKSDQSLSISWLSRECGLSPRSLNKLFLKEVGTTPKNWMVVQKVNKAKELLRSTNLTVTDISLDVGYSSLSKFISTFHKHTGSLPSQFRNKND